MAEELVAIITNVQRFSTEDGPGIRTTVFFKGCPLRCPWCHNPEGLSREPELAFSEVKCIGCNECVKVCKVGAPVPGGPGCEKCEACFACAEACPSTAREVIGREYSVGKLFDEVKRDEVFYEKSGGGVTASGGEAMVYPGFLAELFRRLREAGINTALDTSAVVGGEALAEVLENTDLILLDLKIMDEERHKEVVGASLKRIIENIARIDSAGIPIVIRVPVVPGFSDDDDNMEKIAEFAKGLKNLESVELLSFHQLGEAKYRKLGKPYSLAGLKPPPKERMEALADILRRHGIEKVRIK